MDKETIKQQEQHVFEMPKIPDLEIDEEKQKKIRMEEHKEILLNDGIPTEKIGEVIKKINDSQEHLKFMVDEANKMIENHNALVTLHRKLEEQIIKLWCQIFKDKGLIICDLYLCGFEERHVIDKADKESEVIKLMNDYGKSVVKLYGQDINYVNHMERLMLKVKNRIRQENNEVYLLELCIGTERKYVFTKEKEMFILFPVVNGIDMNNHFRLWVYDKEKGIEDLFNSFEFGENIVFGNHYQLKVSKEKIKDIENHYNINVIYKVMFELH